MKYKFLATSGGTDNTAPVAVKFFATEKEAKEFCATSFATSKGSITYTVFKATQSIVPIIPEVTFTDVT